MKQQDKNTNYKFKPKARIHQQPQEATRSGELNERQIIQAIDRHNQSPFPVLNRPERKLVQQHMIEELTQGFEHRRQALSMALETRLHSIQEACNHVLVTGKTHLRQQRIEYFGQVFRQVEQRMNQLADDFLKDMDARFVQLDSFKSEAIKQREQQRLEKSIGDFLDTLDQLMDEFRSIISEHISHGENKKATASEEKVIHEIPPENDYTGTDEYGVNDVVDQFMEANIRNKEWG